jgi:hypothetical protein
MSSQNKEALLLIDQCVAHPEDPRYHKNVKVMSFPHNCTSTLQPLDQEIMGSHKHYYFKKLVRKTISMTDKVTSRCNHS